MTAQIMDTIEVDDQSWSVCRWNGLNVVPSNESLGFETEMESTANYRGRVDHFVIERGKLRLSHVEANLTAASRDFLPRGGAREDIKRTQWVEVVTDVGDLMSGGRGQPRPEVHTSTRVVLYFVELWVPFSGTIIAGRDFDHGKYVHMGVQRASSFRSRLLLDLKKGRLTGRRLESDPPTEGDADAEDKEDEIEIGSESDVFDDEKTQSD